MLPSAPLKRRFAALIYESLLIAAVTAVAFIPAGLAALFLNKNLPIASTTVVSLILLASWWLYCKLNWFKKRQTLPMQVWHIGLQTANGNPPSLSRLRLRFIWACVFIVFIPLIAYGILHQQGIPPKMAFSMALTWWILPWGFAFFHHDRQFLYDFLAGTRLVDLKQSS